MRTRRIDAALPALIRYLVHNDENRAWRKLDQSIEIGGPTHMSNQQHGPTYRVARRFRYGNQVGALIGGVLRHRFCRITAKNMNHVVNAGAVQMSDHHSRDLVCATVIQQGGPLRWKMTRIICSNDQQRDLDGRLRARPLPRDPVSGRDCARIIGNWKQDLQWSSSVSRWQSGHLGAVKRSR